MAFEYGSGSGSERLKVKNPFKVENLFLFLNAAFFAGAGLMSLLSLRAGVLQSEHKEGRIFGLLIALVCLLIGVTQLSRALTQLRFFFGRNNPEDMNPKYIKPVLHRQSLQYQEPQGPIDGLLYSMVPNLIHSPVPIQAYAQALARKAITLCTLIVVVPVALLGGSIGMNAQEWHAVSGWIGIFFFGVAFLTVFSGTKLKARATRLRTGSGLGGPVFLLIVSILGPLLIAFIPGIGGMPAPFDVQVQLWCLLLGGAVGTSLAILSLPRHLQNSPETSASFKQEPWNINCHPSQIMGEFDRIMKTMWQEQIPNRTWNGRQEARVEPWVDLNLQSGSFAGEVLEEFQPLPTTQTGLTLNEAFHSPGHRFLVVLMGMGTTANLVSILLMVTSSTQLASESSPVSGLLVGAIAFLALGKFMFNVARSLWTRFEFESAAVWLQIEGQYTTGQVQLGDSIMDSLKTSSSVVKIESMTFSLRVARLDTVTFGKNTTRFIRSFREADDLASEIASKLREFVGSHSILLAPSSQGDAERLGSFTQQNQLAGGRADLAVLGRLQHGTLGTGDAFNKGTSTLPELADSVGQPEPGFNRPTPEIP